MVFGLAHSIIFIPVFLTLVSFGSDNAEKKTDKQSNHHSHHTVPDVISKAILSETKGMAYDNYGFSKDSQDMCRQTVKTQSTQLYFISNNKMLSSWCHDPDCP